jgi:hypothetical protein
LVRTKIKSDLLFDGRMVNSHRSQKVFATRESDYVGRKNGNHTLHAGKDGAARED